MAASEHRRGTTTIRLTHADGSPAAGAVAVVEQVNSAFGFGCIGFDLIDFANGADDPAARTLADQFLAVFNRVTLPFYWRQFEPRPGETQTERLLLAARWFASRGIEVKGHPLLWHTLAPEWLLELNDDAAEVTMRARIIREVRDFAGVVDHWDAINEAVILPVFEAEENAVTRLAYTKGRVEMVRLAFESALEGNPNARLVLNDFDLGPGYEHLIEDCLEAGIPIAALGLQTHMHQGFRGEQELWKLFERFARFGLPLQLTETTLVSGDLMPPHIVDLNDYQPEWWPSTPEGEARQADELRRHVTVAFEHPAVESLTYWGITDRHAWLGAPAGLIRTNGTPKPAYEALRSLVTEEWRTPAHEVTADADGYVLIDGFAGTYRVAHAGQELTVTVP